MILPPRVIEAVEHGQSADREHAFSRSRRNSTFWEWLNWFGNFTLLHIYARTCKLHENASSAFQGYCSLGITFKSKEKPWQQQNSILTLKMTVPVFLSSTVELKRRNSQVHLLLSHASMDFYRNQSLKREKENANTSDQWLRCKGSSSTTG